MQTRLKVLSIKDGWNSVGKNMWKLKPTLLCVRLSPFPLHVKFFSSKGQGCVWIYRWVLQDSTLQFTLIFWKKLVLLQQVHEHKLYDELLPRADTVYLTLVYKLSSSFRNLHDVQTQHSEKGLLPAGNFTDFATNLKTLERSIAYNVSLFATTLIKGNNWWWLSWFQPQPKSAEHKARPFFCYLRKPISIKLPRWLMMNKIFKILNYLITFHF